MSYCLCIFSLDFFLNESFLKPENVGSRRIFPALLYNFSPQSFTKEKSRMGVEYGEEKAKKEKKKISSRSCSSKTSNKITSKESLAVSHNMVKLEIAGNQLN